MTQPPEGSDQHEPTRRLDPNDDTGAYDESQTQAYSESAQPYQQPAATQYQQPAPTQYQQPTGYYDGPYTQGQQYPQGKPPAQGEPPVPPRKNTGRTIGLSLAIVLALIVIGFVGYRIVDSGGDSTNAPVATSSETSEAPSTTTESTTTESTTETTSEEPTSTDAVPTGQVTYQITGDGDFITLRYSTADGSQFLATAGSPWQQSTKVGRRAELTAIVVRGRLTCTISRGDNVLSTSTSGPGMLQCAAAVPTSR